MDDKSIFSADTPTLCQNVVLHRGQRCGHVFEKDAPRRLLTCRAGPCRIARHTRLKRDAAGN
eukprot:12880035-Prorocentrum_lima.AAC.1